MTEAIVPFFVLGGFLALVVVLLLLAVRRSRRGFDFSGDDWDSEGEERQ